MSRSKPVRVGGVSIPVECKRLRPWHDGAAHKRTRGDKRPVRRRIELDKNLRGARKLSTLVHEMIHQLDIGLAERTVLRLESGIVGMVHDNPELFHELSHRLALEDPEE